MKTQDLNARLFGKANKRKVTSSAEAQQAAKDQTPYIELSVAGEAPVNFKLVTIPAFQIKEKTVVFEQNAREQAFLTEIALADILDTLKEKGQQFPAVGRQLDDGRIEVLDGSRRRMACLYAKRDFLVYVGEGITTANAKFLSDVANAHKPLSLFERGKEMQAMLDLGKVRDQKELARLFQCSEAIVSGALKAASLPLELLKVYPSISELGRPTIVKLHRSYTKLSEEKKKTLLARLSQEKTQHIDNKNIQVLPRVTSEITKKIEVMFEEIAPTKKKINKKTEVQTLVKNNVTYSRSGHQLSLNIKEIDDEKLAKVLEYLQQMMN